MKNLKGVISLSKTISFHNGSNWSIGHNVRDERFVKDQDHIDKSLSKNNLTLVNIPVRKAYEDIFGEAVKEYNQKQKRADRRITDYYNKIAADKKKHTSYECIVQIGNRLSTGYEAEQEKAALKRFIDEWEERNPNLKLFGAVIHCDEINGTVHAHCDYIPVASGNKNGMSLQNSLDKAFKEQGIMSGYGIHQTSQIEWEARERKALYDICCEMGIDVTLEKKEEKRKHQDKSEYISEQKRIEQELEKAENAKNKKIAEYAQATELNIAVPEGKGIGKLRMYNSDDIELLAEQAAKGQAVYEDSLNRKAAADEIIANKEKIIADAQDEADQIIKAAAKKTEYVTEKKKSTMQKTAQLQARIEQQEKRSSELDADIQEKTASLDRLNSLYDEKIEELGNVEARLMNPLKEKDEQIQALQRSVSSDKQQIRSLQSQITDKNSLIMNKDEELKQLRNVVYKVDECEDLQRFMSDTFKPSAQGGDFQVVYSLETEEYSLIGEIELTSAAAEYGTENKNAYELSLDLVNKRIYDNLPEREKQLSIFERMKEWVTTRSEKIKNIVNSIKSVLYDALISVNKELNQKLLNTQQELTKALNNYKSFEKYYNAACDIGEYLNGESYFNQCVSYRLDGNSIEDSIDKVEDQEEPEHSFDLGTER